MSTLATGVPRAPARSATATLRPLALLEARRYATHPLFLLGVVVVALACIDGPDVRTSSVFHAIVPAGAIGLLGIVVMWSLTRRSDAAARAAGAVPVGERSRTVALASAVCVPFAAGLAWWVWALVTYEASPPPADGFPFGEADEVGWVAAVLFGLGPLACVGGPLLGLLVARWTTGRAAPAVAVIAVIATTIVMQGLFEPLVRVRVVMPWTYWGGPFGAEGWGADQMVVFPGSPQWWVLHVACLSALGLILALLHDRERPRRPLLLAGGVVLAVSVAACLLAMWTGIPEILVNPLTPA
ncbi:hypothetical protein [Miltoncostaea oceani]|uniref:hypothetical protein n=1 Tax=Miltoncostaea oceani TaxID=2843216 RepID=UPI001C3E758F|nr:hypothetical protein [Miltoncostaea oceani]